MVKSVEPRQLDGIVDLGASLREWSIVSGTESHAADGRRVEQRGVKMMQARECSILAPKRSTTAALAVQVTI